VTGAGSPSIFRGVHGGGLLRKRRRVAFARVKDTTLTLPPRLARLRYLIVAPGFQPWDLGRYCERLLRADHLACATFAYGDRPGAEQETRLLEAVRQFRPHIVVALKLEGIRPQTLAAIRAHAFVALWYVDCFGKFVPRWLAPLLAHVDLFLTSANGMVPTYRRHTGAPVRWVYEGAHLPSFPRLRAPTARLAAYRSEVAFVGNVRHSLTKVPAARERLLHAVHRRFDLRIWGPQGLPADARTKRLKITEWPAYNQELVRVCNAAAIVLGINEVNSVDRYFSNRTFLTLACGGFHVTHYVPGLESMFENRRHLVWFHSDDECLDLIRYYLDRPRERRAIARAGQAWTRRRYGMRRSWRRILSAIDEVYPGRRR
jgi:hypothetical protein